MNQDRMLRLILVRETWDHMAAVSGFDPFAAALQRIVGARCRSVHVPASSPVRPSLLQRLARRAGLASADRFAGLPPSPAPFAQELQERAVQEAVQLAAADPEAVLVLSVAENQFGRVMSGAPAAVRARTVACFHQPASWMRLNWRDVSVLEGLKLITCVSEQQRRDFSSITSTPACAIRLGVRLDFFKPAEKPSSEQDRLVVAGQWLRDFDVLLESMRRVWSARPGVELDCVIPRSARNHPSLIRLARSEKVRWHANISAESLRSLYQEASLLFLPLLDATANCAVAEAMACGLPVVSTRIGGIPGNVPEACGQLCEPDSAADHADAVLSWLADAERRIRAGVACRAWAEENLNWDRIAAGFIETLAKSSKSTGR